MDKLKNQIKQMQTNNVYGTFSYLGHNYVQGFSRDMYRNPGGQFNRLYVDPSFGPDIGPSGKLKRSHMQTAERTILGS